MGAKAFMYFDGIRLEMTPTIYEIFPVEYTYESFPDNYCGPGSGFGQKLVPDYIFYPTRYLKFLNLDYSIKLSIACWIHDEDWWFAQPTWADFKETNGRFKRNMIAIIKAKARNEFVKARALYRPITYRNAVTLHGASVFWTIKAGQGYVLPNEALCHVKENRASEIALKIKKGILPEVINYTLATNL